jgi:hypothetical protein
VITSELLEAYLACPLKCYLQSTGEKCFENEYAVWYRTKNESYCRDGIGRLATSLQGLASGRVDLRQLKKARCNLHSISCSKQMTFRPTFMQSSEYRSMVDRLSSFLSGFVPSNKPTRANRITVGFDSLVLSKAARQP